VSQTSVYPREIVNLALQHFAHAVIIVHNHPGGETQPSRADISVTKDIDKALAVMGITLHDHLIVAGINCVSLKSLGHLQELSTDAPICTRDAPEMHQRYKELALSLGVVTQLGSGLAGKLAGFAAGAQ